MVTVIVILGLNSTVLLVMYWLARRDRDELSDCWQQERQLNKDLRVRVQTLEDENESLLKQKQVWGKNPPQTRTAVLNSAQARRRTDQDNARFWSAEQKTPNSEILKENSNG